MMSLINLILQDPLINILSRFIVNMAVIFILVKMIYYKYSRKEEYLFSFFMMGIIIFFICSILETVDIQLGMALGLFAIFAILRFRTVNYTVKDMTYIFVVIGISVINSQANISPPVIGAIVINVIIIGSTFVLELFYQKNALHCLSMVYNKTGLLVPSQRDELIKELSAHTGLDVKKVVVRKINMNTGNADIDIFYKDICLG